MAVLAENESLNWEVKFDQTVWDHHLGSEIIFWKGKLIRKFMTLIEL